MKLPAACLRSLPSAPLALLTVLTTSLLSAACSDSNTGAVTGEGIGADQIAVADATDPGGELDAPSTETPDAAEAVDAPADVAKAEAEEDPGPPGFAYLVVEPEALDFGEQVIGSVVTGELELENAGNIGLTLSTIRLTGDSEAFACNLGQLFLGPGQRKQLKVTFYALAAGAFEDVLRFESNAINDARLDVPLSGVGLEPFCDDLDGDGRGIGCALGADCNESDPTVYWGAPESCNQLDDDCDGLHDEDFVGLGQSCEVGFGACTAAGYKICGPGGSSLVCSVNPVTGGSELCNEIDDDCDGATDEDFPSKGKLCTVGEGACAASDKYVCAADGTALVCNVTPGDPVPEICADGIDNDCDGVTDEGELEVCNDGVDNDCDGETDESGSNWGEVFFARNYYSQTVVIYPSNLDGTFGEPEILDFGDGNHYGVHAIGDFDGDRWFDLVVVRTKTEGKTICARVEDCPPNNVCYAGTCQPRCSTDAECAPGEKCVDTDWDDFADKHDIYCIPPRDVMFAFSACDGSSLGLQTIFTLEPGQGLGPVIDADGDGHLDFTGIYNWSQHEGFTWMNDGEGHFEKVSPSFDYGAMLAWSYGLVKMSKDVDGDGIVDMMGKRFDSGGSPPTRLFFFRGKGDGTFEAPKELGKQFPMPANMVTFDDFDGDGDQDLVGGLDDDGQPGNAWILLSLGAPDAEAWVNPYPIFDVVPAYNSGGDHPGVGNGTSYDFDRDDQPDVLAAWTPEECGSYVWNCPAVTDQSHPCYGGYCRKVAYIRNNTANPCFEGTSCIDGKCQEGCEADCSGKQCGSDGCGGSCGTCGGGQLCTLSGQCVVDCVPQCTDKECGDNGCGGVCGECAQGESCLLGTCTVGCVPSCSGKECGDDGCGGRCAVFEAPMVIEYNDNSATNVTAPSNVPPTRPTLAIEPAAPTTEDDLICVVAEPSYDLDPVTYRYRWSKNGTFAKEIGGTDTVPASRTQPGETWVCRVKATDGIEWSPLSEASAQVSAEVVPEGEGGNP